MTVGAALFGAHYRNRERGFAEQLRQLRFTNMVNERTALGPAPPENGPNLSQAPKKATPMAAGPIHRLGSHWARAAQHRQPRRTHRPAIEKAANPAGRREFSAFVTGVTSSGLGGGYKFARCRSWQERSQK